MASPTNLSVQSLFDIKGWVCVVTGGGSGLGLITARALSANGAKVYITGRRAEKLKDAEGKDPSGGEIIALQMDVTSKDSIRSGVAAIAAREKCVNLLVNNAGVTSENYGEKGMPTGDIKTISEAMMSDQDFEDWTSIYSVN
ncbi:hypothetical protein LTS18_009668, partial [Coniosporium uncinatum]